MLEEDKGTTGGEEFTDCIRVIWVVEETLFFWLTGEGGTKAPGLLKKEAVEAEEDKVLLNVLAEVDIGNVDADWVDDCEEVLAKVFKEWTTVGFTEGEGEEVGEGRIVFESFIIVGWIVLEELTDETVVTVGVEVAAKEERTDIGE